MRGHAEADELLAAALIEDAVHHEQERYAEIATKCDDVHSQLSSIMDPWDRRYSIAIDFWDGWGDARNHEWLYYEPIRREDWPRLARHIAAHLRRGEAASDPIVLEQFDLKPSRPLRQRLSDWFHGRWRRLIGSDTT